MNLIKLFEKAINEHGSATVLKERIKLLKDVLKKTEQDKLELETEVVELRKENKELIEEIEKLYSDSLGSLNDADNILLYLAKNGDGRSMPKSNIQSGTQIRDKPTSVSTH